MLGGIREDGFVSAVRRNEVTFKLQLPGQSKVAIWDAEFGEVIDKLIIHRWRYVHSAIRGDLAVKPFYIVLESALFDYFTSETFAFDFRVLPHAVEKKQPGTNDGDNDDNKNQRLPGLGSLTRAIRQAVRAFCC